MKLQWSGSWLTVKLYKGGWSLKCGFSLWHLSILTLYLEASSRRDVDGTGDSETVLGVSDGVAGSTTTCTRVPYTRGVGDTGALRDFSFFTTGASFFSPKSLTTAGILPVEVRRTNKGTSFLNVPAALNILFVVGWCRSDMTWQWNLWFGCTSLKHN